MFCSAIAVHSSKRFLETSIFGLLRKDPLPTSRSLPACSAGALPRSIASPAAAACSRWWPPPSAEPDPSRATPRNAPSSGTSADDANEKVCVENRGCIEGLGGEHNQSNFCRGVTRIPGSGLKISTISLHISLLIHTSSTTQCGGGSFRNRKPIGGVSCCESRIIQPLS